MAQTMANKTTPATKQEAQKQEKKQAKHVSKLQLEVEQARGDLQKAEQKMARMHVDYEVATARLRTLEEELTKLQKNHGGK